MLLFYAIIVSKRRKSVNVFHAVKVYFFGKNIKKRPRRWFRRGRFRFSYVFGARTRSMASVIPVRNDLNVLAVADVEAREAAHFFTKHCRKAKSDDNAIL